MIHFKVKEGQKFQKMVTNVEVVRADELLALEFLGDFSTEGSFERVAVEVFNAFQTVFVSFNHDANADNGELNAVSIIAENIFYSSVNFRQHVLVGFEPLSVTASGKNSISEKKFKIKDKKRNIIDDSPDFLTLMSFQLRKYIAQNVHLRPVLSFGSALKVGENLEQDDDVGG